MSLSAAIAPPAALLKDGVQTYYSFSSVCLVACDYSTVFCVCQEEFQKNFKKFFALQFVFLPEFLCIVTNFRMKTYAKSQVVYAAFK
jgi:hypothetical protein